jgi:hypothetical protein
MGKTKRKKKGPPRKPSKKKQHKQATIRRPAEEVT